MSKSNDFYPGTTERVCLITGTVEGIVKIHNFIMDKIKEKPDPNSRTGVDFDHKQPAEREKQVKILVPNSTAGMIIGKGGSYIKQIKEDSNVYIQLSQKSRDHALAERSITIIGELEPTRKAVDLVLAKIVEDPQSGSCLNVSYADAQGPVANFNPTGSPYANPTNLQHSPPGGVNNTGYNSNGSGGSSLSPTTQMQQHYAAVASGLQNVSVPQSVLGCQNVESLKMLLRQNGFQEQATSEILGAFAVLANHGLLGPNMSGQLVNGPTVNMAAVQHSLYSSESMSVFGPVGSLSGFTSPAPGRALEGAASVVFDPFRRVASSPMTTPPPGSTSTSASQQQASHAQQQQHQQQQQQQQQQQHQQQQQQIINNNSFGLGTAGGATGATTPLGGPLRNSPAPGGELGSKNVEAIQKDVEVGENIVGAILGPGGKHLVEIQRFSGASIQISKKGIFAPGTRNRIVSITGCPNAVATAHYLIQQHVAEEEAKRSQQNILPVLH
ncbi:RNA-binding protein Nova-2 [Galendromus occidentalis]|uniref:RNA-binding protein Nova-2 n=1 Tax=Galendromus occidentalis TaxID=34638 RepID=A0AAJ7SED6_9ACAR|nr:RNA-binding protein Nova-2 [Galendromus occidentalis]